MKKRHRNWYIDAINAANDESLMQAYKAISVKRSMDRRFTPERRTVPVTNERARFIAEHIRRGESLDWIAEKLGISRERTRQLAVEVGEALNA